MFNLFISLTLLAISLFIVRKHFKLEYPQKIFIFLLCTLLIFISCVYIGANYFTGSGIDESVVYTVFSDLTGAGLDEYIFPFSVLVISFFLLLYLVWRATGFRRYEVKKTVKLKFLSFITFLSLSFISNPAVIDVYKILSTRVSQPAKNFDGYYIDPSNDNQTPTKNIIYIYVESLERTYFNDQSFPGLTTQLSELKEGSYDFSNTIQLPGTGWSVAGLVASQCGIPFFSPFLGNSANSLSQFFPGITCLGDILKSKGYNLHFYQGTDLSFAGHGLFLKNHGFDNIYGRKELASAVKDPSYKHGWGWYDDTLLDIAFQKYLDLAKSNKPFGLFLFTIDTHHPNGYTNRGCDKPKYNYKGNDNSSMSAVYCTQKTVAEFINKIKSSAYFKNTVIVVSSDHLAMKNTAYDALTSHERRNLFMLIDSDGKKRSVDLNKLRSTMDNGATALDAMGGSTKGIGLGRSSFQKDSLFDVFPDMAAKVNSWKNFVVALWRLPKNISKFTINKDLNQIKFADTDTAFKIPVLFKIKDDSVELYFDRINTLLADFDKNQKFLWIDECSKIKQVFSKEISTGLCVVYGTLSGGVKVENANVKKHFRLK